jgi:hypothetical protein
MTPARQTTLEDHLGFQAGTAVADRWQWHWCSRWVTAVPLKHVDMEDIVQFSPGWKLQSICHCPQSLHDLIRPKELRAELVASFDV